LGSVVGIHFEVEGMYTGTLIAELTATVARAEQRAEQEKIAKELHEIFAMQIPIVEGDRLYKGAA